MSTQTWLEMVQLSAKISWFRCNTNSGKWPQFKLKITRFHCPFGRPVACNNTTTPPSPPPPDVKIAAVACLLYIQRHGWQVGLLHGSGWVTVQQRILLSTPSHTCQRCLCGHRRNRLETFNRRNQNPACQPNVTLFGLTKVNTAYSGVDMNVSWNFILIPPIKCPDISLKTTETNLVVDIHIQPNDLLLGLKKEQSVALDSLVRAFSVSAFIISKTNLNNISLKHWNRLLSLSFVSE